MRKHEYYNVHKSQELDPEFDAASFHELSVVQSLLSPAPAELSLAVKECKCWLEDRGQRGGSDTQPAAARGYGPAVSG